MQLSVDAQVPKKVMVEHFTNTYCSSCASRNPGFYSNLNNQTGIFHLSIHSDAPYSQCLLYQQNGLPSNARKFYYGITSTPSLIINGFSIPASNNYSAPTLFNPFVGQTTPVSIRMEQQKYGNDSIRVRVVVKTEATHSLGTQQLFVGLAEDTVFYTAPNGENQHYDVYRAQMELGTVTFPAVVGDSLVYDYLSSSNVNWDFSRIFAFALLQNISNKSITQVEVTSPTTNNLVSSTFSLLMPELSGVSIFPNPVDDLVYIEVQQIESTTATLFSLSGQLLKQKEFEKNISFSLQDLPSGIYLMQVQNQQGILNQKLIKK